MIECLMFTDENSSVCRMMMCKIKGPRLISGIRPFLLPELGTCRWKDEGTNVTFDGKSKISKLHEACSGCRQARIFAFQGKKISSGRLT